MFSYLCRESKKNFLILRRFTGYKENFKQYHRFSSDWNWTNCLTAL